MYPEVDPQPSFPKIETDVLALWAEHHTFEESIRRRADADEYVFYDGPPFANGLPHYGHLLTGFVKDAVPRYQTMRGQQVERRFGWDCHGLPAEVVVEKELGISGHPAITEFGIDKFNDACRTSVLRFTDDWHRYVTRQARWVDFDNDYKTLDLAVHGERHVGVQDLVGQGLDLRGLQGAGVLLAVRDTAQQHRDAHGRRVSRSAGPGADGAVPARLGRADAGVDDDPVDAAEQPRAGRRPRHRLRRDGRGRRALHPRRVTPRRRTSASSPTPCMSTRSSAAIWSAASTRRCSRSSPTRPTRSRCSAADFVAPRTAPASCTWPRASARRTRSPATPWASPPICPMDEHGRFTAEVPPWAGVHVFDANPDIVKELKARGVVVRHDSYNHSYPHCWRCAEPLVYRAISSWFVQVIVVPRPHGRAQPADPVGARARQGGQLRQVAGQRPRLEHQPQPVLGLADPGVAQRRPQLSARSTSTDRSPISSATSVSRSTTCTARTSTTSCARTPTIRPAAR